MCMNADVRSLYNCFVHSLLEIENISPVLECDMQLSFPWTPEESEMYVWDVVDFSDSYIYLHIRT